MFTSMGEQKKRKRPMRISGYEGERAGVEKKVRGQC